jgi:uncharacterized protein (DUF58 family)
LKYPESFALAMLTSEIIRKIKKVHFRTARQVNTMMAGQYRSVFRGSGIEFDEVRQYASGDGVKDIDWKVSARLGKPFVKRFREERELSVMLLVDMSASGNFGTTNSLKRESAAEIAGMLAFIAVRNNDRVGAVLFTDKVERYIPLKKGVSHVWRLIREIFAFVPVRVGTDIGAAVKFFGKVCRKRSVSFLISDFICRDYETQISVASRKHDLIAVLLTDPGEFELPGGGIITFRDLETGNLMMMDSFDRNTRQGYIEKQNERYRGVLNFMKNNCIDTIQVRTDKDPADALTRFFRYRERKFR